MVDIEVIYTIRDRSVDQLERSIDSLESYRRPFIVQYTIVDSGSQPGLAQKLQDLSRRKNIHLIRTETEGWPWWKTNAINIAARRTSARFLATIDMDMVFDDDPLLPSLKIAEESLRPPIVHCRPLWLPPSGKKSRAWKGDEAQVGGYCFAPAESYRRLHGLDERILFWGMEDIEWSLRLRANGHELHWIDDQVRMYHVWHPVAHGMLDRRPSHIAPFQRKVLLGNQWSPMPSANWGGVTLIEDRPALLAWRKSDYHTFLLDANSLIWRVKDVVGELLSKKKLCLDLGSRFSRQRFAWIGQVIARFSHLLGLETRARANNNLDDAFLLVESIRETHNLDYYVNHDMSKMVLVLA